MFPVQLSPTSIHLNQLLQLFFSTIPFQHFFFSSRESEWARQLEWKLMELIGMECWCASRSGAHNPQIQQRRENQQIQFNFHFIS